MPMYQLIQSTVLIKIWKDPVIVCFVCAEKSIEKLENLMFAKIRSALRPIICKGYCNFLVSLDSPS